MAQLGQIPSTENYRFWQNITVSLTVFTEGGEKMTKKKPDLTSCCVTATACCLSLSARQEQVHCLQDYEASAWTGYECKQ